MYPPRKVKAVTFISLLSLLTGIWVMIGLRFHIPFLLNVFQGYVSMKFNAALCFVLLGAALLLTQFQIKKYNAVVFLVLSSLITIIGILSVSQNLFHFNSGLDQLFIADKNSATLKYPFPGRMADNTSVCFAFFGFAFFGFSIKNRLYLTLSQYLLHVRYCNFCHIDNWLSVRIIDIL